MIRLFAFLFVALIFQTAQSQSSTDLGLEFQFAYSQAIPLGGYVQVREDELIGDHMAFKSLNMASYPSIQLQLKKHLGENQALVIHYNRIYFKGESTFQQDLAYNGTLIDGRSGIDVSPSKYYRLHVSYSGLLYQNKGFKLNYLGGIVYDVCTFYLDGKISKSSSRYEVYEGFYRQALPYPVFGLSWQQEIKENLNLSALAFGTYIPRFASFYQEGGTIDLRYNTFESRIQLTKNWNQLAVGFLLNYRYMFLLQESLEDTNELETNSLSPGLVFQYQF
jgi:hypothetical protein